MLVSDIVLGALISAVALVFGAAVPVAVSWRKDALREVVSRQVHYIQFTEALEIVRTRMPRAMVESVDNEVEMSDEYRAKIVADLAQQGTEVEPDSIRSFFPVSPYDHEIAQAFSDARRLVARFRITEKPLITAAAEDALRQITQASYTGTLGDRTGGQAAFDAILRFSSLARSELGRGGLVADALVRRRAKRALNLK